MQPAKISFPEERRDRMGKTHGTKGELLALINIILNRNAVLSP